MYIGTYTYLYIYNIENILSNIATQAGELNNTYERYIFCLC